MLKLKPLLADFLGVLTPQTKTTGVLQTCQQRTVNPTLTPDHAPDGCMANPGFRAEITHGRNRPILDQSIQHVLKISRDLNGASKHGIIDFDLAKSRLLITPREIAGAGSWCSSGLAYQSKGEM